MKCRICSAEITAPLRRVYCSDACLLIGARITIKECVSKRRLAEKAEIVRQGRLCGKCGNDCGLTMDKPLLWSCESCRSRKGGPKERPCKICATVFTLQKGYNGVGLVRFCSEACVLTDKNNRSREFERRKRALLNTHDGVHCEHCGKTMIGRHRKFCNTTCRKGHQEAGRDGLKEAA